MEIQPRDLTQSQLLMWTGQELNPQSPLYNMVLTFELKGALDIRHFTQSFQKLLAQSDAMRTVFKLEDGVPKQQVKDDFEYSMELIDLSDESNKEVIVEKWVEDHSQKILDLSDCAFESALIKLTDEDYIWYLNQHHLITDAWGVSVQYQAMVNFYRQSSSGEMDHASLIPPFQDFIRYERNALLNPENKEVKLYWNEKVRELPPAPGLYGYREQVFTSDSQRISIELGIDRSNKLRDLTAEQDLRAWTQHLSLYNIFATVLFAFVHRVSGQQKLAIGTPAHNRPTAVFKETPGVFIELFPLISNVEDHFGFDTLFRLVSDEVNGFLRYAVPGATSAELNRGFHVILNYIHASFSDFHGIPMSSKWVHPGHCDPRHHLRLQVHDFDASGNIQLHFDLNTQVFDKVSRTLVPQHFLKLLDAFIEDRSQAIGKPLLLTDLEYQDLTHQEEDSSAFGESSNMLDLFASQVTKTADAPAIIFGDQVMSYQDLDHRSSQLANYLVEDGIEPEDKVVLYLERSVELLIAVWGVLKTGAAYVPLATNYPKDRVAYIAKDVDAPLVITSKRFQSICKDFKSLSLNTDWEHIEGYPTSGPKINTSAGDLAYIIYTSGSTGPPKGVMITHKALTNYVLWARETYFKQDKLAMPFYTTPAFDLTVTTMFTPLVSGGSIVVYPEVDGSADLSLLKVIEDDLVDIIKLTPSHLTLLDNTELETSRVKKLIVGGENFKSEAAKAILKVFGNQVEIYNEYGPTEATVGCVVHKFDKGDLNKSSVPIGKAISSMQVFLLDEHLNPVPQGVPGELCLSGSGLASGYWNNPALSDEKFIPCPFSSKRTMYRTGDIARFNSNGNLEYLGRKDKQIKIAGVRVELGEIEAAINTHEGINHCVVNLQQRNDKLQHEPVINCQECGLPSNYPSSEFDENGICNLCRSFESYQRNAAKYFKKQHELETIFKQASGRKKGDYDCIMLLSGGKDSTYALANLVDMGLKVLGFTLDNGYISDQAKANIRRVVNALGVDHVFGETSAMNAIFVDSLNRHCNVCNGCFKTIYTLSTKLALEKGIPIIVTGLSRGQFFETRLTEELFNSEQVEFDRIDQTILEARKAYHRTDDAVNRLLDVSFFSDDEVFDKVQFVDFYRFCDVSLDQMLSYLEQQLPWIRPTDTGRSTNCLINQVGIYVHKKKRGYSNYAFPYSWDVRLGHKTRDASIDEVNEEIDEKSVSRIMTEIGYHPNESNPETQHLVAYYVSDSKVSQTELRQHLANKIPDYMIPAHFREIAEIPLTTNGKIDFKSLPGMDDGRPDIEVVYVAPDTEIQILLSEIWSEVLQIPKIGVNDDFLQLGGNSLAAIRLMSRINETFELDLSLNSIFEHPSIAEFCKFVEDTIDELLGEEGQLQ